MCSSNTDTPRSITANETRLAVACFACLAQLCCCLTYLQSVKVTFSRYLCERSVVCSPWAESGRSVFFLWELRLRGTLDESFSDPYMRLNTVSALKLIIHCSQTLACTLTLYLCCSVNGQRAEWHHAGGGASDVGPISERLLLFQNLQKQMSLMFSEWETQWY